MERDSNGFILAGPDLVRDGRRPKGFDRDPYLLETSVPGIFVAGDVRSGSVKRVGGAIGEGAQVVAALHGFLGDAAKPSL